MKKLESQIQKEITELLTKQGFWVIRNHTQGIKYTRGRGTNPNKGIPDLLAIKNGKFFFIEVKKKGGSLSEEQKAWIKKAYDNGIVVHVVTSVEDVIDVFMPW